VDIGLEKNGFLSMSETVESSTLKGAFDDDESSDSPGKSPETIENVLQKGQEILVQVLKEPIGSKGARLSTQISLPGRFLVLMPFESRIGVSRRISERAERARLRGLLREIGLPEGMGAIVRTAALSATKRALTRDLRYLLNAWKQIQKQQARQKVPSLVHEEMDLVLKSIRDHLLTDVDKIVVDSKVELKKINRFVDIVMPSAIKKIELYRERSPLFRKYGLEDEIEKLFQPVIRLKCGGSIVMQQTEALVSIDVNTGRHKGKKDQAATILKTNLEAAVEVAKQLRLRNVGGIIVIDFIDMESRRHQKQVLSALIKELKKDKARTRVYPISELGLVEMTRQREQESFLHMLYETCPACRGQGLVKTLPSLQLELERKLMTVLHEQRGIRRFRIEATPGLARHLLEEGWDNLRRLGRINRVRINVVDNVELGFGEYVIWAVKRDSEEKVS